MQAPQRVQRNNSIPSRTTQLQKSRPGCKDESHFSPSDSQGNCGSLPSLHWLSWDFECKYDDELLDYVSSTIADYAPLIQAHVLPLVDHNADKAAIIELVQVATQASARLQVAGSDPELVEKAFSTPLRLPGFSGRMPHSCRVVLKILCSLLHLETDHLQQHLVKHLSPMSLDLLRWKEVFLIKDLVLAEDGKTNLENRDVINHRSSVVHTYWAAMGLKSSQVK